MFSNGKILSKVFRQIVESLMKTLTTFPKILLSVNVRDDAVQRRTDATVSLRDLERNVSKITCFH